MVLFFLAETEKVFTHITHWEEHMPNKVQGQELISTIQEQLALEPLERTPFTVQLGTNGEPYKNCRIVSKETKVTGTNITLAFTAAGRAGTHFAYWTPDQDEGDINFLEFDHPLAANTAATGS